jgi:hypothetical protein
MAPGRVHGLLTDRLARAARAEGWTVRSEVTGSLWRADLMCYRDGACVALEAEAGSSTDMALKDRHYERLHAGAWCFWFFARRRRRPYPAPGMFHADEIETRIHMLLHAPTPVLVGLATPIPRPEATTDAWSTCSCRVCGAYRRLIARCWRCGFTGGPYYPPVSDAEVEQRRADFALWASRAAPVPAVGVFADLLAWRAAHQMVPDPQYSWARQLVCRSQHALTGTI